MKEIKIITNILGERELRFTNSRGTFFTSTTDTVDEPPKYCILKEEPWYITDAYLDRGLPFDRVDERFDNLTQVYIFVATHFDEFI